MNRVSFFVAACLAAFPIAASLQAAGPTIHSQVERERGTLMEAAPSQRIEQVVDWNREFRDLPMHVAWNQDEWSVLPDWGMPTYYVFRHGRLARRFSGWLGITRLKQSLREAGAFAPAPQ